MDRPSNRDFMKPKERETEIRELLNWTNEDLRRIGESRRELEKERDPVQAFLDRQDGKGR